MTKFVWHNHAWRAVDRYAPRPPRRTPYIITDTMSHTLHPATGQMMDSKAAFRAATRAAGYEEVGNDTEALLTQRQAPAREIGADIAQAIQMLEQGYQPPPLETLSDWGGETRITEA